MTKGTSKPVMMTTMTMKTRTTTTTTKQLQQKAAVSSTRVKKSDSLARQEENPLTITVPLQPTTTEQPMDSPPRKPARSNGKPRIPHLTGRNRSHSAPPMLVEINHVEVREV